MMAVAGPGPGPAPLGTLPGHAHEPACRDGRPAARPQWVDKPARPGRGPRHRRAQGGRLVGHRPGRGPRLPGGRNRPDRRRGRRAVPAGLVGCHRGVGPPGAGRQRRGARRHRRHRLHLAVVGHRAGRRQRVGHRARHHLDGLPGRPRGPRDGTRCAERAGLLGVEAGPLGAPHRRHPEPVGQGPGGPHPLPAPAAPRRLRGRGGVPRAGRLPQPAPHRTGPGLARLDHAALGDRQPRHQRDRLRRVR